MNSGVKRVSSKQSNLIKSRFMKVTSFSEAIIDEIMEEVNTAKITPLSLSNAKDENPEFNSDLEYIYALLWQVGPGKRRFDDCQKLMMRLGSPIGIFNASLWDLETLCQEMGLCFSGAFVRRRLDSAMSIEQKLWLARAQAGNAATNFQSIVQFLIRKFAHCRQEEIRLLYLDESDTVTGSELIAVGNSNSVKVEIKEILSFALRANAKSFIISHNHFRNGAEPSERDLFFTRQIEGASLILGVTLFDHIIIFGSAWFSFRVAGLLEGKKPAPEAEKTSPEG